MSIVTAIQNARNKIANAYAKVEEMGGTLPTVQNLNNLPSAIESVTTMDPLIDGSVTEIDTAVSSIRGGAFANCSNLTSVTLRSNTVVDLSDGTIFENTPIASKTGNVYVPEDLLMQYLAKSYAWSTPTTYSALTNDFWEALSYDGTKFVALGERGTVAATTDGVNWEDVIHLPERYWQAMVYNGSMFVAIGSTGYFATSPDGINWYNVSSSGNLGQNQWRSLTYGKGALLSSPIFVALGFDGFISTSTDGVNWTEATRKLPALATSVGWQAISCDGKKFVAISEEGHISTSPDGNVWTSSGTTPLRECQDIVYDGTKFIALNRLGQTAISLDGLGWYLVQASLSYSVDEWESLTSNGSKLMALGRRGHVSMSTFLLNILPISE